MNHNMLLNSIILKTVIGRVEYSLFWPYEIIYFKCYATLRQLSSESTSCTCKAPSAAFTEDVSE